MQSVTTDNCITYEEMLELEARHDKFLERELDTDIQDTEGKDGSKRD